MSARSAIDPRGLAVVRYVVLAVALLLYLREMASPWGIGAGLVGLAAGILAARAATRRHVRPTATATVAFIIAVLGGVVGHQALETTAIPLSVTATLHFSEVAQFLTLAFGLALGLRALAHRYRTGAVLEAAWVVGAVAHTFRTHRQQMIHRPRFLTDWAWSQGLDPQTLLHAAGLAACVAAVVLLLRPARAGKLATSLALMVALAAGVFHFTRDHRIEPEVETGGLGLTSDEQKEGDENEDEDEDEDEDPGQGQDEDEDEASGAPAGGQPEEQDTGGGQPAGVSPSDGQAGEGQTAGGQGEGQSDGSGGGQGDSPFSGDYDRPEIIIPVAIAILRDEYSPPSGFFYFRQQVQSYYDGNHLVTDTSGRFDQDVIVDFPDAAPIDTGVALEPDFHLRVPTSMVLVVDHPQPLALSSSIQVAPEDNPDPTRFAAAYGAVSLALATPLDRLIGRRSVPETWSPEQRAHYLTLPDDPRYEALSDIIVRRADPRFVGDDMVAALMIKRYLEQEGFYTRKRSYDDEQDPAGAFLFGDMHGYCVHFAHAAAFLLRSQGIAARVAVGYAANQALQGSGSSIMITNDTAHAWPEIHIEGAGWITFDIYPEASDEPPPQHLDQDLKSVLGELARNDPTAGKSPDPDRGPLTIPWAAIGLWLLAGLGVSGGVAYGIKGFRRFISPVVAPGAAGQRRFRATLDRLSDIGLRRRFGESREGFARRVATVAPTMQTLTEEHLRLTLGRLDPARAVALRALCGSVEREVSDATPLGRRLVGWLHPVSWWFTR